MNAYFGLQHVFILKIDDSRGYKAQRYGCNKDFYNTIIVIDILQQSRDNPQNR